MQVITLTTDFGLDDSYVGVMKGVLLSLAPNAAIVDLTHAIASYDVLEAALTLAHSAPYFPPGTIHVMVVDPGVGTARRPLVVEAGGHGFVAPDNGVLSLILEREPNAVVRHANRSQYFLPVVSNTFHGRDVFAPLAAHLARGVAASELGDPVTDAVRLILPAPQRVDAQTLRGEVLRVDKFGNLATNLRPEHVPALFAKATPRFTLAVGRGEVSTLHSTFGEGLPGDVFLVLGSMGFLEIAANLQSAAELLAAGRGSGFVLRIQP